MPAVLPIALLAASLLLLAGALKLVDPASTAGALRALGLPSSPTLVRVGSAAEALLGLAALTIGGWVTWVLVGLSYAAFAWFVVLALRAGTMVGSCGCFGREDTPPHWTHVLLDALLAVGAVVVSVRSPEAAVWSLRWSGGDGLVVVGATVLSVALLHAAFVDLPRTLVAARAARPGT